MFATPRRGFAALLTLIAATAAPPTASAEADASIPLEGEGVELFKQVMQTYQEAKTYQSTAVMSTRQVQGRWTTTQTGEFYIAYQRDGRKLKLDQPEFYIVIESGHIRLKSDQIRGRYLSLENEQPVTYESLKTGLPVLAEPIMPDIAMLLAEKPLQAVTGLKPDPSEIVVEPVTVEMARAAGRGDLVDLRMKTVDGMLTLAVDPESHIVREAVYELDVARFGGEEGETYSVRFTYDDARLNKPLADDAFAFDADGPAAESLEAYVTGQGMPEPPHPLVGEDAPTIESTTADGKAFDLGTAEADVIVLDFWATWCPPCREGLPEIQAVADWAKENKKPVAVYAVNVGETAEQANSFMEQAGLSLPVVLDAESAAAEAYGVRGIPQTVVIADGKVIDVHVGFKPTLKDDLIEAITGALDGGDEAVEPAGP